MKEHQEFPKKKKKLEINYLLQLTYHTIYTQLYRIKKQGCRGGVTAPTKITQEKKLGLCCH